MRGNDSRSQKQGEHRVVLTQVMHLSGRVARPYNICVGATLVVALARTTNGTDGAIA
jgi:hypothetical protein